MKTLFQKLFTGPIGTFVKTFIVGILLIMYEKHKAGTLCFDLNCLRDFLIAAAMGTIPFIINWINPEYKEYGRQNKQYD